MKYGIYANQIKNIEMWTNYKKLRVSEKICKQNPPFKTPNANGRMKKSTVK